MSCAITNAVNALYAKEQKKILSNILKNISKRAEEQKNKKENFNNIYNFILQFAKEELRGYDYTEAFYKISSLKLDAYFKNNKELFLFEAPPRSGKTDLITLVVIYLICINKKCNFLFVLGSKDKRDEFSDKVKRFLNTDFIKKHFSTLLTQDLTNNITRKVLTNGNTLLFKTSPSSAPTGMGFNFVIFIDYFTQGDYDSPAKRSKLLKNTTGYLTREEHSPITKILIDNQRLGDGDLTSYILNNYTEAKVDFDYLQFPYIFKDEWSEKRLYSFENLKWEFAENEYLVKRFNEKTHASTIAKVGARNFKIQYQGIIDGIEGGIIEEQDFKEYQEDVFKKGYFSFIVCVDTALKGKNTGDYSVISLFAFNGKSIYLVDLKRGKWLFNQLEEQLEVFLLKWERCFNSSIKYLIIEDTAQGAVILNTIRSKVQGSAGFRIGKILQRTNIELKNIQPRASKFQRLSGFLHYAKANKIFLPCSACDFSNYVNTIAFKKEMLEFTGTDTHRHDDMVDTFIMACEEFYITKPMFKVEVRD